MAMRLMTRRNAASLHLLTRNGHDWASRFPLIVQAIDALRLRSCLIDGEAVCCDDDGLPVFRKFRQRRDDRHVFLYAFFLYAFDLIELDGSLQLNERIAELGDIIFPHASRLGLEGIVSKRLGSQ